MIARLLLAAILLPAAFLRAQDPAPQASPAPNGPPPALRARLSDLAGALGNEGFKVRDGWWTGKLEGGKPRGLKLNLFAGNQYWLCAAAPEDVRELQIAVFDADGKAVTVLQHAQPGLVAAGLTVETTGLYVVELRAAAGQSPDFCFTYLFK
jgi:hypothetical protein